MSVVAPAVFREIEAGWHPEPVERTEVLDAGPAVALAGLFDVPPPATRCRRCGTGCTCSTGLV